MKAKILFNVILLVLVFIPGITYAQNEVISSDLSFSTVIRTPGKSSSSEPPSFTIKFTINDMPNDRSLKDPKDYDEDELDMLDLYAKIQVERKNSELGTPYVAPSSKERLTVGPNSFNIIYEVSSKQDVEWYAQDPNYIKPHAKEDIELLLDNDQILIIKKEAFNTLDFSSFVLLNDTQREDLLDALGGFKSIYYDRFDAGWRDSGSDSLNGNGYIDFAKSFNLFNTENLFLFLEVEGLLSTDIDDISSYLKISPVSFNYKKIHLDASYQTSLDSDEQRILGRVSLRGLIKDNPLDSYVSQLSKGYNRLRLKPYFNAGVSAIYYTQSDDSELSEGQFLEPYFDFLYIVPISEKYTARFDTYLFWRSERNKLDFISDNIKVQGTLQLSYGIGTDAEIVGKYSYGTFGLTNEIDNRLMIGFLMDILSN
ncbi:MAG: hypothetical protein ED557_08565 [Balneola sp.]|nr:MAG: hypothetical protein ED557_08565 [Balneola sp.]